MFLAFMYTGSWMSHRLGVSRTAQLAREPEVDAIYLGTEGVVFQDGGNTCGPAALKMILDHHGVNVRLRELERKGGQGKRGMDMLSLSRLAQAFGLYASGWRLDIEDLQGRCLPAILFVENTHFVVLDSVHPRGDFFVRDPAKGKMRLSKSKLMNMWGGETLLFCSDSTGN
jgi:ABC-type bacteriocin/lantibiotic exporter with double-glycine peptidase domain